MLRSSHFHTRRNKRLGESLCHKRLAKAREDTKRRPRVHHGRVSAICILYVETMWYFRNAVLPHEWKCGILWANRVTQLIETYEIFRFQLLLLTGRSD
jgi:hypothetical protein